MGDEYYARLARPNEEKGRKLQLYQTSEKYKGEISLWIGNNLGMPKGKIV